MDKKFCPPVASSGDYIGIPTKEARTSGVTVMYTIFLLPALKERARGCIFDNSTEYVHATQIENLRGTVIQYFCDRLLLLVTFVVITIVLTVRDAMKQHANPAHPLIVQQSSVQGTKYINCSVQLRICNCIRKLLFRSAA